MEWGIKAYDIMWELKEFFDSNYVLNLGVIFNRDLYVYEKNFKFKLVVDFIVDMCMECGFCEFNCLIRDVLFTSR